MRKVLSLLLVVVSMCFTANAGGQQGAFDADRFDRLKSKYKLTDAQTYEVMGQVCMQIDDTENAENNFKKAVELDPSLCFAWYNLGLINMDNPEHYFKKAIEAEPGFAWPYYWLAMYYHHSGKKVLAKENFGKYLETVDINDPQEEGRVQVAYQFMKE